MIAASSSFGVIFFYVFVRSVSLMVVVNFEDFFVYLFDFQFLFFTDSFLMVASLF
jgi:hypothetical protein